MRIKGLLAWALGGFLMTETIPIRKDAILPDDNPHVPHGDQFAG